MIPRHMYITQLHYDKPANGRHLGFPHTLPFLQGFDSLSFKKPVTIFVGENGTGKSTLIETLAALMELNLEGGSKNHRFETEASHSSLYQYCRLTRGPIAHAMLTFTGQRRFIIWLQIWINLQKGKECYHKNYLAAIYTHFLVVRQ